MLSYYCKFQRLIDLKISIDISSSLSVFPNSKVLVGNVDKSCYHGYNTILLQSSCKCPLCNANIVLLLQKRRVLVYIFIAS